MIFPSKVNDVEYWSVNFSIREYGMADAGQAYNIRLVSRRGLLCRKRPLIAFQETIFYIVKDRLLKCPRKLSETVAFLTPFHIYHVDLRIARLQCAGRMECHAGQIKTSFRERI